MASKLEHLRNSVGGNVDASMGAGRVPHRLRADAGPAAAPAAATIAGDARKQGVSRSQNAAEIRIDRIERDPKQPREEFDPEGMANLANSLKTRGQLQPIRVRWDEGRGAYVIICGERRWRAAAMAGLPTLTCVIHEGEVDVLAVQLIENALREDLKPIEQAKAYRALMEVNGWDAQRLAVELSVTGAQVSRTLALLALPETVQDQVEQGTLSQSAAYEVSKLDNPVEQEVVAKAVVDQRLTRDEVGELVRAVKARKQPGPTKPDPVMIDLGECVVNVRWRRAGHLTAAEALRQALGTIEDV